MSLPVSLWAGEGREWDEESREGVRVPAAVCSWPWVSAGFGQQEKAETSFGQGRFLMEPSHSAKGGHPAGLPVSP